MRIGVVGINHKLADLKLRELLAKACHRRFGAGESTHGERNFVLLSTCNRTEVYFSSEELANTHSYLLGILRHDVPEDFNQKLYSYFGFDCFLHLCRVTAGLDSAIIAETEIQGQVKSAYEQSSEYYRLPHELHYLFQKSLSIAKKVRSDLPMKPGLPDIEHAILNTGHQIFKKPQEAKILFVGASDINKKIMAFLKSKNIRNIAICNRSYENGRAIAEKYQIELLRWESFYQWQEYDWIIFGTKSPNHLISEKNAPTHHMSQKLIIDLSVPRNVDPNLSKNSHITLLNIDQLNRQLKIRRKSMNHCLVEAEELVEKAADRHINLFQEREKNRLRLVAVGA